MDASEDFAEKDTLDVVMWLKDNGMSQENCDCFVGGLQLGAFSYDRLRQTSRLYSIMFRVS